MDGGGARLSKGWVKVSAPVIFAAGRILNIGKKTKKVEKEISH
jgi:hypothetical protein